MTIRRRATASVRGPIVDRAVIGVGSSPEPLVWLETGATLRPHEPLRARVNLGHPILGETGREVAEAWRSLALPEPELVPDHDRDSDEPTVGSYEPLLRASLELDDVHPLPVFAVSSSRPSALPPLHEPLRVSSPHDEDEEQASSALADEIRTFLEMVVLGTTQQLASALRSTLYIGPLRTVPPRGFLYERPGRITSWADGLAAWDRLLDRGSEDLVERTNAWLRRLGAGCQVVVQELFDPTAPAEQLTADSVDGTARRLILRTDSGALVLPSEVGSGISQVLPIIVAALHADAGLLEQPELHVHPAIQVGLGDLFIESALREGGHPMLVETHSEHVVLRVLRRIRQTTNGELPPGAPRFSPEQLSVCCVEQGPYGVRIYRQQVDEEGDFVNRWPNGFFAERREELL